MLATARFDRRPQLHPWLPWYMIGVSKMVLIEGTHDISIVASSTDIRTRGKEVDVVVIGSH